MEHFDKNKKERKYDLEERTFIYAKKVIEFIGKLPKTLVNTELARQLVRSAGSVGANYIEANESLGQKDFLMRIKICRKEAKESCFWRRLINCSDHIQEERAKLLQESIELTKIFGAILVKTSIKTKFQTPDHGLRRAL